MQNSTRFNYFPSDPSAVELALVWEIRFNLDNYQRHIPFQTFPVNYHFLCCFLITDKHCIFPLPVVSSTWEFDLTFSFWSLKSYFISSKKWVCFYIIHIDVLLRIKLEVGIKIFKRCIWQGAHTIPGAADLSYVLEGLNITFTSNGKPGNCTTWLSFLFACRSLFIISTPKWVVSRNFYPYKSFWAVFTCSFSILRNSQLESDVCRMREA